MNERFTSPQYKFGPHQRLTNSSEYEPVLNHPDGVFRSGPIRILAKSSALGNARLGLVIPKRVVRKSTDRNGIKRIVREWFRTNSRDIPSVDVVVIIRSRPSDSRNTGLLIRSALERWKRSIGSS
ncbi:MAG: ribonuclease P protein component [Gammaproteobacteria bacterium]|nr:ribonuclease P protein component [Gammaproteobacteria bacterium]